jgi:hypothetical protein
LQCPTMNRSDSRIARQHSLSLRCPSCFALAVSAAGTLRASFVPCVSFSARHALRPRQALDDLTMPVGVVLGSAVLKASPLASGSFEAEWLKQDASPACGSRLPVGTLLVGCSLRRWPLPSSTSPPAKQPSVLGCWLDFSIHRFHSELRRLGRQTWGTFTPGCAQLHEAHQPSTLARSGSARAARLAARRASSSAVGSPLPAILSASS